MYRYITKRCLWPLIIILAGCSATVERRDASFSPLELSPDAKKTAVLVITGSTLAMNSEDWPNLQETLRSAMLEAGKAANLPVKVAAQVPADLTQPATIIVATVQDYRIVSGGSRLMLGSLIGNAFVEIDVSFLRAPEGKPAGERKYSTKSSGGHGIFGATTARQLQAISNEVIQEVIK